MLFADTLSANKKLFADSQSANKKLFADTQPAKKKIFADTRSANLYLLSLMHVQVGSHGFSYDEVYNIQEPIIAEG